MAVPSSSNPRVFVIGGSLAGLMAALALRGAGCEVEVFERVAGRLEGHGAGLRIVPELGELLEERAGIRLSDVSTFVERFRVVGPGDFVLGEETNPAQFTSWGSIHGALAHQFGAEHYHLGENCVGLALRSDRADVAFAGGKVRSADLVVFADGILSTGRRLLAPSASLDYAGYVAWRGYVPEAALSAAALNVLGDAVVYCVIDHSHIGVYPIPHPTRRDPSERFFNFVWYRNAAPGEEMDHLMTGRDGTLRAITVPAGDIPVLTVEAFKATAVHYFPPSIAELIVKTEAPFLQAIYDLKVPRMAFGRACLIGDAAFVARPHAGAAAGKAAINAWRLADCVRAADGDIPTALATWEPAEMKLGAAFVARNQAIGRRSLVEGRYDPLDPALRPGLYGQPQRLSPPPD